MPVAEIGADIVPVNINDFATPQIIQEKNLGVGDDTFMIGLFTEHPGRKRALPIVRNRNICMMPTEPIQVDEGFAEAYLAEARSLGGLSGSPIFVRRTTGIRYSDPEGKLVHIVQGAGEFYLLGLVHDHWDIKESELNKPSFIHDRQRGVNYGIVVVVPAYKILDLLAHPTGCADDRESEAKLRNAHSPEPDNK